MAILTDDAIVLGARPYSNTSLIVTFLTKHHGKARLMARGARAAKAKSGVGLEPASESHLEWSQRGGNLGKMRKCETTRIYRRLWEDYEAMRTASRLLRVLDAVLDVGEGEGAHYQLLRLSLETLEGGARAASMEGVFLLMLLKATGLRPVLAYCAACEKIPESEAARFDLATGELRCARCPQPPARGMRLRGRAVAALREVLRFPPEKCFSVQFISSLRPEITDEITKCAEAFWGYHGGRPLPRHSGRRAPGPALT